MIKQIKWKIAVSFDKAFQLVINLVYFTKQLYFVQLQFAKYKSQSERIHQDQTRWVKVSFSSMLRDSIPNNSHKKIVMFLACVINPIQGSFGFWNSWEYPHCNVESVVLVWGLWSFEKEGILAVKKC